jgi:hypothetical protein
LNKPAVYKLVTFILLFLLSFTIRLIALYQTPYANGWDGYYYIMQMYTFIENGAMRAPDYSIIYSFYIFLYSITHDYIFAYKLGSALLAAIFTISVYLFSYYLVAYKHDSNSGSKAFYLALFVAIFSIFSPTLTYFTAQFPKNLLGIIFLLWFIYFINKQNVICLILFFVLSFLTHRMSAGFVVIVLIISLLKGKHFWALMAASLIGIIGLSFLPGILHFADIERFKHEIDLNFPPLELIRYFGIERLSILWMLEIILLFGMFIYFFIYLIKRYLVKIRSSKIYIHIFFLLLVLSLPVFKFEHASIGFRFYLSFTILSFLLLPFVMRFFRTKVVSAFSCSCTCIKFF